MLLGSIFHMMDLPVDACNDRFNNNDDDAAAAAADSIRRLSFYVEEFCQ